MHKAERAAWTKRVLSYLNHAKRRCTFAALGGLLGVTPRLVGQYLGRRRKEASWVVSTTTGEPTGYEEDQLAEGLRDDPHDPINCPEELHRRVLEFESALQSEPTVDVFLDFPMMGEDGRLHGIYGCHPMNPSNEDHLSNEVSLSAGISRTGLSANAKSRAVAALDRFIGSAIDIPTAGLEKWAEKIRTPAKGPLDPNADPVDTQRMLIGEIQKTQIIQPFVNRHHVARKAVEKLATDIAEETEIEQEVDADWLNYLGGYAEKATTDTLRNLWAKVLAGEIRKPGAFSLMTLRFLAEADREIAETFVDAVRLRLAGKHILLPDRESYQGETIARMRLLEQAGLLDPVSPNDAMARIGRSHSGVVSFVEGDLCLRMQSDTDVRYRIIPLTRIGKEVATLLDPVDPQAVLRNLAQSLPEDITPMALHRIESEQEDTFVLGPPLEVLRPPPA